MHHSLTSAPARAGLTSILFIYRHPGEDRACPGEGRRSSVVTLTGFRVPLRGPGMTAECQVNSIGAHFETWNFFASIFGLTLIESKTISSVGLPSIDR